MERQARNRSTSFNIEITGNEQQKNVFMAKLQHMKTILRNKLNTQVTNSDVFNSAMDIWIGINDPNQHLNNPGPPQYDEVEENNTDQNIFV